MKDTGRFDARTARDVLLKRGGPSQSGFVRLTYRPFDNRWLYWESATKLLDEKRADYRPHVFEGNMWLSAAQHLRQGAKEPQTVFTKNLGSHHLIERGTNMFPAWLRDDCIGNNDTGTWRANLSGTAQRYLDRLGANMEDLFHYVLAVLHDPAYREANAGALRMEWPRIPLPDWPEARPKVRRWNLPNRQHMAVISRPCSIPKRPCSASPRAHCARRLPRSLCLPPRAGATWRVTISCSPQDGDITGREAP